MTTGCGRPLQRNTAFHYIDCTTPVVTDMLLQICCYRHVALLLILPAIQITFYSGTVGSDVKDVKLLFDNNDTGEFGLCVVLCVCSALCV